MPIRLQEGQVRIDFSQTEIYWGTYFMIHCQTIDGTFLYSSVYNTNDFISPQDLTKLLEASSIESAPEKSNDTVYNIATKSLEVGENTHLEIFDSSGVRLYSGVVNGSFPLHDYSGRFLIIRAVINNQVSTMKIIVK